MSDILLTLFLLVLSALIVLGFSSLPMLNEKAECESGLPRNVECVWAAPEPTND